MFKKKIFHHSLVTHLAKGVVLGVLSSNIIGIAISSYILYNTVSIEYIKLWIVISTVISILRLITTKTFLNTPDSRYDIKYIRFSMLLLFFNALLYSHIIYCAILYNAEVSNIFLIVILIISLVAGSVSTLGAIFPAFAIFAGTTLFLLILNLSMMELESVDTLLLLVSVFSIFFIISGYKNNIFLKSHILLEERQLASQDKLKKINDTLETRVKEEVAKNTKQLQLLQQQSKMAQMGEMIGAIAHQWRQPLNVISTSIQNLKYDYQDGFLKDEKYIKEFIDKNKKTIGFMSSTIDDFRNFFRVDKERVNFHILKSTQSVIDIQSIQLKEYDIDITLSGEEFEFYGFASEYQQVILNLVSNAKDMLIDEKIENPMIKVVAKDGIVTIEDNAGGMPDDIIDRIFEPYFTTKEQGKGTGMGLYMSKIIIEDNMGGELSVENIESGAIFTIDFNKDY